MQGLQYFHAATMMRNHLFLLAGLMLCIGGSAYAQKSGTESSSSGRAYRLQALYRAGVAQSYEITEQTTVERTHSDSSKKTYDRTITYFTTIRCIESMDGISKLVVNIDSLRYRFTAEGKMIQYDSQEDITPKNFADLNNYIGPLNRPYTITVSPYGEVSGLEGEQIQFWRDYLAENSEGLDSVIYLIWSQSLDEENLYQYGDLQKRVIPGLRIEQDSSWDLNLSLRVDGVVYSGSTQATFSDYSGGMYSLTVNDTIPVVEGQKIHVYDVPYITTVAEGTAIVDHTVKLSATGTIQDVTSAVSAWFRGRVVNEVFTQKITSTTSWKLTGQYQW